MATSAQIDGQSTAVFDELEIERIREIAGLKTYAQAESLSAELSNVQRQATRMDIKTYGLIGEGTVGVKGGKEGADYSQSRDREDIRQRLRLRLGLDAVDPDLSPNAARISWVVGEDWLLPSTSEF